MSETIIAIIVITLSVLWMIYMMSKLFDSIAWGRGIEDRFSVIVPIFMGTQDIEYVLGKAIEARDKSEGSFPIIVLDYGAEEETKKVCRIICGANEGVSLMSPEELNTYFVELDKK